MTRSLAYIPIYTGDYHADTQHLTTEEHGAYLLLMFHYWNTGGLSDDEAELRRITKLSRHKFSKIFPKISKFFQKNSAEIGGWSHRRLDRERAKALDIADKRAEAGRAGGSAKAKQLLPSIPYQYKHKEKSKPKKKVSPLLDYCQAHGLEVEGRAFLDMRRKIKSPPTERAEELLVIKLQQLEQEGSPPGEVLDQSTVNGWKGLFQVRRDSDGQKRLNADAAGAPPWERVFRIPENKLGEFCRMHGLSDQAQRGDGFEEWRAKIAAKLKQAGQEAA